MDGKANYMRIWLNRYQYLSLYGPEYTQLDVNGNPVVYFDNTINQKDSAELDYIIEYAAKHGIAIMPCIFSFGDFSEGTLVPHTPDDSTCWHNNPFNTISDTISNFFVNNRSKTITKNLLRYIVSRWGYATNIMCWELWNEVSNMFKMCDDDDGILQHNVLSWHNEMATCLRNNDPYKHCVSTSMGIRTKTNDSSPVNYNYPLYLDLFDTLDIVQQHNYQNIQKAASIEQVSKILFDSITKSHNDNIYPSKPFFMGEFGFGQSHGPYYVEKDPYGIDLHNSLWSSLFSTAIGPGSFWWWHYLKSCGLFHQYAPLLTFCQNMPILSETFTAYQTGEKVDHELVFPNNLQTYYMINATEDTIYGWSQDTAFAYQSLRWLTDSVDLDTTSTHYLHFIDSLVYDTNGYVYKLTIDKRPGPSFNNNTISIPITNWPIGSRYKLTWYDSEAGLPIPILNDVYMPILINNQGNKAVNINFPHLIRNLKQHKINNKFGDVVFRLVLEYVPQTKFINDATIAPINQTN